MASNIFEYLNELTVTIPKFINCDCHIRYEIKMKVADVEWTILRRYSEFVSLHERLVSDHGLNKDILPPKKIINNMDPQFLETRRQALEVYIKRVISYFLYLFPHELVIFVGLQKYDMWFLLEELSQRISAKDWLNCPQEDCKLSIMEVHCISERIKRPCPPLEIAIKFQQEFCSILEFCTILEKVEITSFDDSESNINTDNIKFDLNTFKNVKNLKFSKVLNIKNFVLADMQRKTLFTLCINDCGLAKITDILLCDRLHKDCSEFDESTVWRNLKKLDLSSNALSEIDSSLSLTPTVEILNFAYNNIHTFNFNCVRHLKCLKLLSLSKNNLSILEDCLQEIPTLIELDLSHNKISTISPLKNVINLQILNLEFNSINDFTEIRHICILEKLKNIYFRGNPVSNVADYRIKVLLEFGNGAQNIILDNEMSTQKEIELVSIKNILRNVRDGKTPAIELIKKDFS